MAENGILKCGRLTDFQAHQIEHQLGAYTDCNPEHFETSMEFVRQNAGGGTMHDGLFADESDTLAIDDYLKNILIGIPIQRKLCNKKIIASTNNARVFNPLQAAGIPPTTAYCKSSFFIRS